MRLSGARASNEHDVALLDDEVPAGQITHETFVDCRSLEREVFDVLCQRQFGDCELVLDGARLLLRYLGFQEIADEALLNRGDRPPISILLENSCRNVGQPDHILANPVKR